MSGWRIPEAAPDRPLTMEEKGDAIARLADNMTMKIFTPQIVDAARTVEGHPLAAAMMMIRVASLLNIGAFQAVREMDREAFLTLRAKMTTQLQTDLDEIERTSPRPPR